MIRAASVLHKIFVSSKLLRMYTFYVWVKIGKRKKWHHCGSWAVYLLVLPVARSVIMVYRPATSLGGGRRPTAPGDTIQGVSPWWKSKIFAAEFTKNTEETITWNAKRVGVVTMTKKVVTFFRKNRVTLSFTAPADTNPSDATDTDYS